MVVFPQGREEVAEDVDGARTPLPVVDVERRARRVFYHAEESHDGLHAEKPCIRSCIVVREGHRTESPSYRPPRRDFGGVLERAAHPRRGYAAAGWYGWLRFRAIGRRRTAMCYRRCQKLHSNELDVLTRCIGTTRSAKRSCLLHRIRRTVHGA